MRTTLRCLSSGVVAFVSIVSLGATGVALAADLRITNAWVLPVDKAGADAPLHLTIVNDAAQADALLRVRCPIANFSERYTVDHGEGAPSKRAIPSIPIKAQATVDLDPKHQHVMLLQVREPLTEGSSFPCSITFRQAGTLNTDVKVSRSP